jgi:coenzyme F420-reducing hydrogenase gamma subunit
MSQNGKPKIAFFDFTSCEGCQLTVVDSLQDHPELLQVVEIVQFREAMTEKGEDYQIAFIEGSCTRESDETRLKQIREQAAVVIALGTCAHLGGVNTLKALHPLEEVRRYVYGEHAEWYDTYDARPIDAVIPVDYFIPGCPIDRDEFTATVKALLLGKRPPIPDYPLCVECKLKENTCMFTKGKVCLGPVTRAGCKAICPTYGQSCEACRGFITNPNDTSMRELLAKHNMTIEDITSMYTMFTTYQVRETLLTGKARTAGND